MQKSLDKAIIREYNHEVDQRGALELCQLAHATTVYKDREFDPARVSLHGQDILHKRKGVFGYVAVVNDKVVGLLFGSMCHNFINLNSTAQTTALYVHPDHRSIDTFIGLITAFESWAKEDAWCDEVVISVTEMSRCESVHRLCRRHGYHVKARLLAKAMER